MFVLIEMERGQVKSARCSRHLSKLADVAVAMAVDRFDPDRRLEESERTRLAVAARGRIPETITETHIVERTDSEWSLVIQPAEMLDPKPKVTIGYQTDQKYDVSLDEDEVELIEVDESLAFEHAGVSVHFQARDENSLREYWVAPYPCWDDDEEGKDIRELDEAPEGYVIPFDTKAIEMEDDYIAAICFAIDNGMWSEYSENLVSAPKGDEGSLPNEGE